MPMLIFAFIFFYFLEKMIKNRTLKLIKLGRISYRKAFCIQKYFERELLKAKDEKESLQNILLVLEHDPVYTLGFRQQINPVEVDRLKKTTADVVHSDRGGLDTFHGPGQLVIYPIINIERYGSLSLRKYVSCLENAAVHTCRLFGVDAQTEGHRGSSHTGAWANNKKIAAIGVHCKRFITTHGLALNCNLDLKWFDHIVPCGIKDKGVTSLSNELGENISTEKVIPVFLSAFESVLGCTLVDHDHDHEPNLSLNELIQRGNEMENVLEKLQNK